MDDSESINSVGEENSEEGNISEEHNSSSNEEDQLNNETLKIIIKIEEKPLIFLQNSGFTYEPYRCPKCQIGIFEYLN